MQCGASLVARRGTMAATTAMTARNMMTLTKTTKSTTTTMWAKMEPVTIMAALVTSAVAGTETLVPFHVAVRGDQAGPEAVDLIADLEEVDLLIDLEVADLHHHPRQGGVVRAHRRAATRCCQSIQ